MAIIRGGVAAALLCIAAAVVMLVMLVVLVKVVVIVSEAFLPFSRLVRLVMAEVVIIAILCIPLSRSLPVKVECVIRVPHQH